jgi:hypothetical protein
MKSQVNIAALRRIIETAFPDLWLPTEAGLATILAMVPDDVVNPPTCILTGAASTGKTTILDLLGPGDQDDPLVYRSDKFSPASFVTHTSNVKREQLPERDLLPRIKGRTLVTPELGPTFRGREEVLTDSFALLTAVLDGHGLISDSGSQGRRGYVGDEYLFAWLGATTPLPTATWRIMAQLGSRLFFYAMPDVEVDDAALEEALAGASYRGKVAGCRDAARRVLEARLIQLGGVRGVRWDRTGDPPVVRERLKALARLTARLRGIVSVWKDRDGDDLAYTPPNIEAPYRALACLYNLARGRALLHGRTILTAEDLGLVVHVALSSAPYERTRLLRGLMNGLGTLTTGEAATALQASLPTARKAMKALDLLGVADLTGDSDHVTGGVLTLRPEWQLALGVVPEADTGADAFQPGLEEVESEMPLCVSAPAGAGEVDPWAS